MDSLELINSGLDTVNTVINYLAKDAVGSDFMNQYVATRDVQKIASEKQTASLKDLINSSNLMEENTKSIASGADVNIDGLNGIYNTINSLKETTAKMEADYKHYVEQFQNLIMQTKTITGFISEIQKISSQTNLLSFNASIEAAHAGTAGAGFRIIANEVKKLSDNTEKSASKMQHNVAQLENSITELEEETKQNTDNLRKLTEEVEDTLKNYDSVRNINSSNLKNIESFTDQISENVRKIDDMINTVEENEALNNKTVQLFADCASKNNMLFNDLYSFVYEIKAIFEALKNQKNGDVQEEIAEIE